MEYFTCNLPTTAPDYLEPDARAHMQKTLDRVRARHLVLESALSISGLEGKVFHKYARNLFQWLLDDSGTAEAFDQKSAQEIAQYATMMWRGEDVPGRLEWPNCDVLFDTAFTATKEWESLRRLGLGGSDGPIVLGLSPYRENRGLYHDKIGTKLAESNSGDAVFDRGHYLEPRVIQAFCERSGAVVIPETRMFRSKTHPCCTANIDAIIQMPDGSIYVFEAKTTKAENFAAWASNKIPAHYVPQCRQYPAVLNDDRIMGTFIGCLFVVDLSINNRFVGAAYDKTQALFRKVERDADKEQELLDSEETFWAEHVIAGSEPPMSGDNAMDAAVLKQLIGDPDPQLPQLILDTSSYLSMVKEYENLDKSRKALEAQAKGMSEKQEAMKLALLEALGTHTVGHLDLPGGGYYEVRNTLTKPRMSVNWERLQAFYPEAYEDCRQTGEPGRRFSVSYRAPK